MSISKIRAGIYPIVEPILVRYDSVILKRRLKNKSFVILNSPIHGNIGDSAIALAQEQFLEKNAPDKKYLEITTRNLLRLNEKYAEIIPEEKIIFIQGGGYMGDILPRHEENIRKIIRIFHNNKIVIFPQTISFNFATQYGKQCFQDSYRIYASHPDLTIFVREENSYEMMKKKMPEVKCLLVPDIVTNFECNVEKGQRKGILMCFRNDPEKVIYDSEANRMVQCLEKYYPLEKISYTDTDIKGKIMPRKRKKYVFRKLQQFASAKLVVTDRLHGMVLAALSGTPCIVMDNCNHKVSGEYQWIKENEYIRFLNDASEFEMALSSLDLNKKYFYQKEKIEKGFEPLRSLLKEL